MHPAPCRLLITLTTGFQRRELEHRQAKENERGWHAGSLGMHVPAGLNAHSGAHGAP